MSPRLYRMDGTALPWAELHEANLQWHAARDDQGELLEQQERSERVCAACLSSHHYICSGLMVRNIEALSNWDTIPCPCQCTV